MSSCSTMHRWLISGECRYLSPGTTQAVFRHPHSFCSSCTSAITFNTLPFGVLTITVTPSLGSEGWRTQQQVIPTIQHTKNMSGTRPATNNETTTSFRKIRSKLQSFSNNRRVHQYCYTKMSSLQKLLRAVVRSIAASNEPPGLVE